MEKTPKEYFVKVPVKEELPTSDGFYFVVEKQPANGKYLFVKSLGLYDSRRKKFMLNVHSWLKPLPSIPEQEWVSVIEARIKHFKEHHHSFEAQQLQQALFIIKGLVPPSSFDSPPTK